jgi:hypothetical protein
MVAMSRVGKIALLVALLAFVIVGVGAALGELLMLWATIGGLIVTDWWKWAGVALATLPVWVAYRLALNRWQRREVHRSAVGTGSPHA